MEDKKERFLSIFNEVVHREGAEELLSWLSNSDFFTAPASTQYHGSHPGGLLEHSLYVYDRLVEELNLAGLSEKYTQETVAIVALLHDICKTNFYKKRDKKRKRKRSVGYKGSL